MDLARLIRPVPRHCRLLDPNHQVWCSTLLEGEDGRFHLYYARWPRLLGHYAWVTHSEIAHAVADHAEGPYRTTGTALGARDLGYWDGACVHNPVVCQFEGRYYLYYMGLSAAASFSGPISMEDPAWWAYRNRQRIGVAVADAPEGPWRRCDRPVLDVGSAATAPDHLCTSNPSVTRMRDGRYLMVYKGVAAQRPLPFGGPVTLLAAVADHPEGPFRKTNQPIFTVPGDDFPAEDPCIWYNAAADRYYGVVKDMHGAFTGIGPSLALIESDDGLRWRPSSQPLVRGLDLLGEDGTTEHFCKLERPQVWFQDGEPRLLLLAAATDLAHSLNLQVPLGEPVPASRPLASASQPALS